MPDCSAYSEVYSRAYHAAKRAGATKEEVSSLYLEWIVLFGEGSRNGMSFGSPKNIAQICISLAKAKKKGLDAVAAMPKQSVSVQPEELS